MADTDNTHDSGSKDRATVALVDAKVDGLRELMRAEFGFIRERVAPLAEVVRDVSALRSRIDDHEKRLQNVEDEKRDDRAWKRHQRPGLIVAAIASLGSIFSVLSILHVFG